MRTKPAQCLDCPLHGSSISFLADSWSPSVKIGILKHHPTKGEINEGASLGTTLEWWNKEFFAPNGFNHSEVGVSNVFRCYVITDPKEKKRKCPPKEQEVNKDRLVQISNKCRQYDDRKGDTEGRLTGGGLRQWNPNAFIITYDHTETVKAAAYKIFIKRAFELGRTLVDSGHRPLILMGREAAELVRPTLFSNQEFDRSTSFRDWIGEWHLGRWPF